MEENKDGDNEKVNDTDDVKTGDLQKTIMLKLEKLSANVKKLK